MLTDRFARRFTYLRLSLTETCNFRCTYCLPDGNDCASHDTELTTAEIQRLVRAFAMLGTRKIRLTGGEPSLRHDLSDIIRLCKQTDGIEQVALTTNGFRIQKDLPKWLEAGLDTVNVSVDSLDPSAFARITGADRLHYVLQGIDQALAMPFRKVKINSVLLKQQNATALPAFLRFIKDRPLSLRFIELMRTGDNGDFFNQQHLSGELIRQQLLVDGWSQCLKSVTDGPALEYSHPDYAGRIGLIMPYSKDFCADCNRLRVSSLGQLFLCLFADQHQSLRHLLQDDDPQPLLHWLQQAILGKEASHQLQQGFSGSTRHLAMIGG
ncbi:GTP 3',8-cyclase MoaA [Thalassolituus sp. LLYu03]|uniref:GTP 3',8-cyclase MoaA n=1 Tax=Thalassolituus sp. LLYu03 TaxID=3421656 RepID=UPI003D268E05